MELDQRGKRCSLQRRRDGTEKPGSEGNREKVGFEMKGKKLFVGNLSHCVSAGEETELLRELFSTYGNVEGVNIVKGKRYGFVEMSSQSEAEQARKGLNDHEFNGCSLKVNDIRSGEQNRERGRRRH